LAQALLLFFLGSLVLAYFCRIKRGIDMQKENGFSLIELLMVVAIVGIIAALAIPNLQKARQNAEAGSAIQSLRTITTAEHLYYRKTGKYGTLADLTPEGTIDIALQNGSKSNYSFVLVLLDEENALDPSDPKNQDRHFNCTAAPERLQASSDYFFVDDTAVIRFEKGSPADEQSDPIPR
jgi:prepilin-type N-terminal cleavage/methylation domain-containing protein